MEREQMNEKGGEETNEEKRKQQVENGEEKDKWRSLYTIQEGTKCEYKRCTDNTWQGPISTTIYNPGITHIEMFTCPTHRTFMTKLWEDYQDAINVVWRYGGKNPVQKWDISTTTWFNDDMLEMMNLGMKYAKGMLKLILQSYQDFKQPEILYQNHVIVDGNIALCNHIVRERKSHKFVSKSE